MKIILIGTLAVQVPLHLPHITAARYTPSLPLPPSSPLPFTLLLPPSSLSLLCPPTSFFAPPTLLPTPFFAPPTLLPSLFFALPPPSLPLPPSSPLPSLLLPPPSLPLPPSSPLPLTSGVLVRMITALSLPPASRWLTYHTAAFITDLDASHNY